jgi:hypothetical protein
VFPLDERFIEWGQEGVATFLANSLLVYEISPGVIPPKPNSAKYAELMSARNKMLEWMRQHSIRPDFIEAYRESSTEKRAD